MGRPLPLLKEKKMLHIGIDPGKNTGVCAYDDEKGDFVLMKTMGIIPAMNTVKSLCSCYDEKMVVFEDARLRKWYGPDEAKVRMKLKGAGSVERDCSIWEEFLKYEWLPYRAVAPKDNTTKRSAEEFRDATGYMGRTNEHDRDAAGLIIKIIEATRKIQWEIL